MRIGENEKAVFPACPGLAAKAEKVLEFSARIGDMLVMLKRIRTECEELRSFFLTDEETAGMKREAAKFDADMQSMALFTSKNLETYQTVGWEQLFDWEDDDDETGSDSRGD